MSTRLAVLCSGGGSNLQAILDYLETKGDSRRVSIALVASDRSKAGALERARKAAVPCAVMDAEMRTTGLGSLLHSHGVEYVALAGYLRFIPNEVTDAFRGRILNIHPALLPAFGGPGMYGHHVHEAVVKAGVRVTGATAHFVDSVYDHGAIIAQWPVSVLPGDTPDSLARRVLEVEHAMYPQIVHAVAAGDITLGADGVVLGAQLDSAWGHFAASQHPGLATGISDSSVV